MNSPNIHKEFHQSHYPKKNDNYVILRSYFIRPADKFINQKDNHFFTSLSCATVAAMASSFVSKDCPVMTDDFQE